MLRLAALGGQELLTPPRSTLGHFQTPGKTQDILDWLQAQDTKLPLIASLDMVCWGGLIASRHPGSSAEAALSNYKKFTSIQNKRQGLTYAFKTILRTTPTQTSSLEVEQAEQIVALSRLCFLKEKLHRSAQNTNAIDSAISQLEKGISKEFLASYLAVRRRNHDLDSHLVSSASNLDCLLMALDDSQTEGWNILEKESLQDLVSRAEQASVNFYPGTDESAQLLLARLLQSNLGVEPIWAHSYLCLTQTRYEDRPLGALLQSQLEAASLRQGRCRRKLFLYGRLGFQQEAEQQGGLAKKVEQDNLDVFLDKLEKALDAGDSCVVADLAFANGGDLGLVEALLQRNLASRLTGYSGWNTAGNTLGTALATLAIYPEEPDAEQEKARRLLLWERLIDDAFYQSRYRFRLKKELGPGLNLATNELKTAENLLAGDFHKFALDLWSKLFPEEPPTPFQITLPWGRLFEVAIRLKGSAAA